MVRPIAFLWRRLASIVIARIDFAIDSLMILDLIPNFRHIWIIWSVSAWTSKSSSSSWIIHSSSSSLSLIFIWYDMILSHHANAANSTASQPILWLSPFSANVRCVHCLPPWNCSGKPQTVDCDYDYWLLVAACRHGQKSVRWQICSWIQSN